MIEIDRYEKIWIVVSAVILVLFFSALTVAAFATGIQLPGPVQQVDPRTVATPGVSPFGEPGLRELGPGRYEVYILAQTWQFTPNEIRIPAGSTLTFYLTSKDVQHGFRLEKTNINMMIIPGQVSSLSRAFDEPGTYNFVCQEYCGIGHQAMFGRLIVEP
ncbi:MAG: cytochrome c oxidase subunit II [Chloroflexota bacterium]